MTIQRQPFGRLPDGREAELFTFRQKNGLEVRVTNFGGAITSVLAPDRDGRTAEVTLGFADAGGYVAGAKSCYFGALVGRVANRIARGRFSLDGQDYTLAVNNGPNHLHGGVKGFDQALWKAALEGDRLRLTHRSPDGDEGYPGNLDLTVDYALGDDGGLTIDYRAVTDRPTPVNLTNHAFFNLTGLTRDVNEHVLTLRASRYTPVDAALIPTGELAPVAGTPFDFTRAKPIGRDLAASGGYDHNFVLDRDGPGLFAAADVHEPDSGRTLEVFTTEPGLQFYGGNFLDGGYTTAGGVKPGQHFAFCLEAQSFPDAVHHPSFPSIILRPGGVYRQTTIYRFGAR